MQCSRCGTYSFDGSAFCGNCGARITEEASPTRAVSREQPEVNSAENLFASSQGQPQELLPEPAPFRPAAPVAAPPAAFQPGASGIAAAEFMPLVAAPPTPAFAPVQAAQSGFAHPSVQPAQSGFAQAPGFSQPLAPVPAQPFAYFPAQSVPEPGGWAEFSGAQALPAPGMPAGSGIYPGQALPPSYPAPGNYPGVMAPTFPPATPSPFYMPPAPVPVQPPVRRWPTFLLGIIVGVLLTLIVGGSIIGLRSGSTLNPSAVATVLPTTGTTPTTTPVDGNLLYQQVTGQTPFLTDSLQNAAQSRWSVFEYTLLGCEIKSDGLHVHIKNSAHFTYCSYEGRSLSNFGFQVEMKILQGDGGGGITFRNDNQGNYYYFHVFPDGGYNFYSGQNHKLANRLATGFLSSFSATAKTTLAVIAKGSQIYLYANHQLVTTVQDTTYTSGFVGLLSDDHTAPSDVVYTNAQIWQL